MTTTISINAANYVNNATERPVSPEEQERPDELSGGNGDAGRQSSQLPLKPRLYVNQKLTALVNKYYLYDAAESGQGALRAFAQQKRFAFKEKIKCYTDQTKQQMEFSFRAEKVLDFHGRFFVEDESGQRIGAFKKDFKNSLVSSTWYILDENDRPKFIVKESNETLAALRRYLSFVPVLGELGDIIMMFFKYHFVVIDAATRQKVGMYTKLTLWRDHYRLDMSDQAWAGVDWRVFASVCVALDALQSR